MKKTQTLVVLARKYNDIYYAMSTSEWQRYTTKVLLIISNRAPVETFPFQFLFDKIVILPSDGNMSNIKFLLNKGKYKKLLSTLNGDTITMSNPEMLINRFIFKYSRCNKIIFLEDGLMNYYNYKAEKGYKKNIICYLFRLNDKYYLPKIVKTYLNSPEYAKYYFGEVKKLTVSKELLETDTSKFPDLNGKRVLIAQNILIGKYNKETYKNILLNELIGRLKIDFYIPRTHDYINPGLKCEILNINKMGMTLEMLAHKYNFHIYGFSSSLLFTLKIINPDIISHRIITKYTEHIRIPPILQLYSNLEDMTLITL